jgi:hypothetical protein
VIREFATGTGRKNLQRGGRAEESVRSAFLRDSAKEVFAAGAASRSYILSTV